MYVSIKVLKDKIFYRVKAFNITQLGDFIFTRLDKVYQHRLLDIANNRYEVIGSRYMSVANYFLPSGAIKKVNDFEYEVPSQKDPSIKYHVDMEGAVCSCPLGLNGGPCRHQHMVAKHFKVFSINVSPRLSPHLNNLLHMVATGKQAEKGWYHPL